MTLKVVRLLFFLFFFFVSETKTETGMHPTGRCPIQCVMGNWPALVIGFGG